MLTFFGLTFHLYGLIVGCAVVVGLSLAETQVHDKRIKAVWWNLVLAVLFGGLIGARAWHVLTDWSLYQSTVLSSLYIWQGGVSILGAVVGGGCGLLVTVRAFGFQRTQLNEILDAVAMSLPIAQAIGRVGNFVNQELYGWPTTLPWGIYIEPAYRSSRFQQFEYFHPLFAYEAILMLLFAGWLWLAKRFHPNWLRAGTGSYFVLYGAYYSVVRFGLDFLRVEKEAVWWSLGSNQLLLVVIIVGLAYWWWKYWRYEDHG